MAYALEFTDVLPYLPDFATGALTTLRLSLLAMVIGIITAIPLAWLRLHGSAVVRAVIRVYIEAIRNTPLLVQIYLVYFGLPSLGLRLSPTIAALAAMTLNVSAYATEIVRSGIQSIDKGQVEAGLALGLRRLRVFRLIVLRPALRAVYPALTSQFIILMLFSSLVSAISANDLSSVGAHVQSLTFRSFEVYLIVGLIYLFLSSLLSWVFSLIERRFLAYPTSA